MAEEKENEFFDQQSIIFIVDINPPPPSKNNISFMKCFETYRNIVAQKCGLNKNDKLGLIIFGTKETNCNVDNCWELQTFKNVTIDTLHNIDELLKDGEDKFKELAAHSQYPIYDVLLHADKLISGIKTKSVSGNVIVLCTHNDNPHPNNIVQRRKIEHLVVKFNDSHTDLIVVGLSDIWNDEIYYKDLQIMSGAFNYDDYKKIQLQDLEQSILYPARNICKLPWKISAEIVIEVTVLSLIAAPKYPGKIKLNKDGSEILEHVTVYEEQNSEEDSLDNDFEDNKSLLISDLFYFKNFNNTRVSFNPSEVKQFRTLGMEPVIEILYFKPITCDPLYHCNSANFITYASSCNKESIHFFNAFVSRCSLKKVMPICKVITKTSFRICSMIPSEDDGGFYMYKIPYKENVSNFDDKLYEYSYNAENKCPYDKEAVSLFSKLMEYSKVKFNPKQFSDQKFQKMVSHIEALALEKQLKELPADSTLPPERNFNAKIIEDNLISILDIEKKDTSKNTKKQRLDFKSIIQAKKLHTLTVAELKNILGDIKVSTKGNKTELIKKIYDHFETSYFYKNNS